MIVASCIGATWAFCGWCIPINLPKKEENMAIKNYEAWLKVMVKDANGDFDYNETKAILREVCMLQQAERKSIERPERHGWRKRINWLE